MREPTAALGIMCKAPTPGSAKTRLARVIGPGNAAMLSACFLRDVADAIERIPEAVGRMGYGVYAPQGSEADLKAILPRSFDLLLQEDADFGRVLSSAAKALLGTGHDCVLLINSDSPTLPTGVLGEAITCLRQPGDRVVLGPALDGGYYLIGLKVPHPKLFRGIPWSTADVLELTQARAAKIRLPVALLPRWYDVDDADSLALLEAELGGNRPAFAEGCFPGGPALATRAFLTKLRGAASIQTAASS